MGLFGESKEPGLSNRNIISNQNNNLSEANQKKLADEPTNRDVVNNEPSNEENYDLDGSVTSKNIGNSPSMAVDKSVFYNLAKTLNSFNYKTIDIIFAIFGFFAVLIISSKVGYIDPSYKTVPTSGLFYIGLFICTIVYFFSISYAHGKELKKSVEKNKVKYVIFLACNIFLILYAVTTSYKSTQQINIWNLSTLFIALFILLNIKNISFMMLTKEEYSEIARRKKRSINYFMLPIISIVIFSVHSSNKGTKIVENLYAEGYSYTDKKDFSKAIELYKEALQQSFKLPTYLSSFYIGTSYLLLSEGYRNLKDYDNAVSNADKAVGFCLRASPAKRKNKCLSIAYISFAEVYLRIGDNDNAMKYADKALSYLNTKNNKETIARMYFLKGHIYTREFKLSQSITYHEKSLAIYQELNSSDIKSKENIADVSGSMAFVYLAQNNKNEAKRFYKRAIEIYKDIGKDESIRNIKNRMSTVLKILKKPPKRSLKENINKFEI